MEARITFSDGRHLDTLFGGAVIGVEKVSGLDHFFSALASSLEDGCLVDLILDDGRQLSMSLIPPAPI
ncbi:MAG: hypothetical protein Q8Q94_04420 [bacterium]|nr:hypothetical protein [bacterium]MDZ4300003.1 hypothetical protein [Candidatus Sungbacteria bacterium]